MIKGDRNGLLWNTEAQFAFDTGLVVHEDEGSLWRILDPGPKDQKLVGNIIGYSKIRDALHEFLGDIKFGELEGNLCTLETITKLSKDICAFVHIPHA